VAQGTQDAKSTEKPFLTDVKTLRERARKHLEDGAIGTNYIGDVKKTIGKPNFNPEGLLSRSASQYAEGANLVDMIRENLIAERIAVDHYRELVRYFGNDDPGTKSMLQGILRVEEEHADDMHDLLIAHEGRPMLHDK